MIDRLQTEIQIRPTEHKIRHGQRILLFGSCFADEIGERMHYAGLNLLKNPTGTLYNPASIAETVRKIAEDYRFTPQDLFCKDGIYSTFSHHGSFYDTEAERFLQKANRDMETAHAFLQTAEQVIITLGTARIYKEKTSGKTVANCHKFPKERFDETMLDVEACFREMERTVSMIQAASSHEVRFIFTVSPIRHLRDGLHENRLSKATLLLAVEKICRKEKNCTYFPAYEIMEDELRDYRFYREDLCHPAKAAADYIWKRFTEFSMDPQTRQLIREVDALQKSRNHRLLFPDSEAGIRFREKLEEQLIGFRKRHPEVIL